MFAQFKLIYLKELRDALRDKRSMLALLYIVFGAPLLVGGMFYLNSLDKDMRRDHLLVEGGERSPGLVAFIEKRGIDVTVSPYTEVIPEKLPPNTDGILKIPDDFSKNIENGASMTLPLFVWQEDSDSLQRVRRIQQALAGYSSYVGSLRLLARGVPAALVTPVNIVAVGLSDRNLLSKITGGLFLLLILFAPFAAGMSVAIDVFAGERERSSLHTLMALPVSPYTLALGKWATVVSIGLFASLVVLALLLVEFRVLPAELVSIRPHQDFATIGLIVVSLTAVSMFVASLQVLLSIGAKSFREAQTYLSIMLAVPMVGGQVKILMGSQLPEFVNYLPILTDIETLTNLLFDGRLVLETFFTGLGISVTCTALFLYLTVRRMESERLVGEN